MNREKFKSPCIISAQSIVKLFKSVESLEILAMSRIRRLDINRYFHCLLIKDLFYYPTVKYF